MKVLLTLGWLFISVINFSQDIEWIKTEGEITDITVKLSRRSKEIADVKFMLEDGTEMNSKVELFRIPIIGSLKSVGDKISIKYDKKNPGIVQSVFGNFLHTYGMYILIFLGVIFSLKPILNWRKSISAKT